MKKGIAVLVGVSIVVLTYEEMMRQIEIEMHPPRVIEVDMQPYTGPHNEGDSYPYRAVQERPAQAGTAGTYLGPSYYGRYPKITDD